MITGEKDRASIPIFLYNGERGGWLKLLFYIFYPAHIIVLYLIAIVLRNIKVDFNV